MFFFCVNYSYIIKEKKIKSRYLQYIINSFFYKNISIIFIKNKNKLYLKEQDLIIGLYFLNLFFFKQLKNMKKNINFIFLNSIKFFSFYLNFLNCYNKINKLYFFRLKLRGLGFVLKRHSKFLFSFLMAVNHFYYFFLPKIFLIKKKKKSIICLSLDIVKLNTFFWNLLFIKKHNVYVRTKKINGFVKTNFIRFVRKKYKL